MALSLSSGTRDLGVTDQRKSLRMSCVEKAKQFSVQFSVPWHYSSHIREVLRQILRIFYRANDREPAWLLPLPAKQNKTQHRIAYYLNSLADHTRRDRDPTPAKNSVTVNDPNWLSFA